MRHCRSVAICASHSRRLCSRRFVSLGQMARYRPTSTTPSPPWRCTQVAAGRAQPQRACARLSERSNVPSRMWLRRLRACRGVLSAARTAVDPSAGGVEPFGPTSHRPHTRPVERHATAAGNRDSVGDRPGSSSAAYHGGRERDPRSAGQPRFQRSRCHAGRRFSDAANQSR